MIPVRYCVLLALYISSSSGLDVIRDPVLELISSANGLHQQEQNGCSTNHLYLPHGYAVVYKSDSFISSEAAAYRKLGFSRQLINLGMFTEDGHMPAHQYTQLPRWASKMHDLDPEARVIAYVNGHKHTHVDGGDHVHGNIAKFCAQAVHDLGCHGVHLDFEPMRRDDYNLLALVREVRARIGSKKHLSLASPASPNWSPEFIRKLAAVPVDVFMPMGYDSSLTSAQAYTDYIKDCAMHYTRSLTGLKAPPQLAVTLPSYAANRWHDPSIETIRNGAIGLLAASREGARVHGAGVWHWYEMSDPAKQSWLRDWLKACPTQPATVLKLVTQTPSTSKPSKPTAAPGTSLESTPSSPSCTNIHGALAVSGLPSTAQCVMRTDTYDEASPDDGQASLGEGAPSGTRVEVYTSLNGPQDCSGYLFDMGCDA
jgi:hypothetical protein